MRKVCERSEIMEKPEESARYDKLATPRERADGNDKMDPFKVKRGALSYRITDSLNALAMPKKMHDQTTSEGIAFPPTRVSKTRPESEKMIKLKPLLRSSRNPLTLDTYAAMVVKNNIQCPSRIKRLAKPKGHSSSINSEHIERL